MPVSDRFVRRSRSRSTLNIGLLLCFFLIFLLRWNAWAEQWIPLGPDGGEVRSLAYEHVNPALMFLGTSTGTIFRSTDGGQNWERFVHLGKGDDLVIDHIVIDPRNSKNMYVGTWHLDNHHTGELFRSYDGGKNWSAVPAMHGKSIRAIAVAASDPKVLVVGALDGVFHSKDGGQTWRKISRQQVEIKNVESIAIDPRNPDVVFAGTRHLAWKTSNAGAKWHRVQDGIIDDSDVFSILVDESNSKAVFLSACSGIYKSVDSGHVFERIQGIPFSARRTRVLRQDPSNPAMVYAGTTEGLWVTTDWGTTWKRVTSPELVVNDVLVDPRDSGHVLLATDRAGVLTSDNGQLNFVASNSGFTHRYISSILVDQQDSNVLYAGIVNDRELGGVFVSVDAGQHWSQMNTGLDGRDVFVLKQVNGSILAGTNNGIFALDRSSSRWIALNNVREINNEDYRREDNAENSSSMVKVNDIEITPKKWLAATSAGLYSSSDEGRTWKREAALRKLYLVSVRSRGHVIAVAGARNVLISVDNGNSWKTSRSLPGYVSGIQNLAITPDEVIIIASREGTFRSRNLGMHWGRIHRGLPSKNINCITYDSSNQRLLATTAESTAVYESKDGGSTWDRQSDTGYLLRAISVVSGRLLATTRFDGLIVQTQDGPQHR